jgi:hypothetical protein
MEKFCKNSVFILSTKVTAASYTMGTGSFPGVKRPGCGADHPPPTSAEVKEIVELYLYSPSGPSWPLLGKTLPFTKLTEKKHVLCGAAV